MRNASKVSAGVVGFPKLTRQTEAVSWETLAQSQIPAVAFDESSRALMRRLHDGCQDGACDADREQAFANAMENLRRDVALDTLKNRFELRRKVHAWFVAEWPTDAEQLTERVYDELFLTPSSDP